MDKKSEKADTSASPEKSSSARRNAKQVEFQRMCSKHKVVSD